MIVNTGGPLALLWRLIRAIGVAERLLGITLIVFIVVAISVQVFTRYLFGRPLTWVEEGAGYAFLWMVFIGAGLGFKELRHIRIDTFVGRLPRRPQHLLRGTLYLLCTVAALIVAWYSYDIMDIESRSNTIALPIELPRHLFYSVPLFCGMASMVLTGIYLTLANWAHAQSGRPIEAELAAHERQRLDDQEAAI